MNKVIEMGRLTRNPDVRYTTGENPIAIARFTMAVDRRGKKQEGQQNADFIPCVAFGKLGEFAEKYLKQGIRIVLEGRITTGSYTNKDGQKVYTVEVTAENIEFAESEGASDGSSRTEPQSYAGDDGFMHIPDGYDEDLPFN